MGWLDWLALSIAVAIAIGWYLTYSASRLDRLHARVEGAASSLDAQLVRRAEVGMELANSGLLDPASAMLLAQSSGASLDAADLADVHSEVREHGVDQHRRYVESALSEVLDATLTKDVVDGVRGAGGGELVDRVQQVGQRVQLSRRFYNDAVHDVRRVRSKPLVRLFRLAGHTLLPHEIEFEDRLPGGVANFS